MKNLTAVTRGLVGLCALLIGAATESAGSKSATIECDIQTVEHLNCGGGLRPPTAPPPDCSNFVSERITARRVQKFVIPRAYLRKQGGELQLPKDNAAIDFEDRISYRSLVPNLYTDAAGYSVDSGTCAVSRKAVR